MSRRVSAAEKREAELAAAMEAAWRQGRESVAEAEKQAIRRAVADEQASVNMAMLQAATRLMEEAGKMMSKAGYLVSKATGRGGF